MENPESGSVPIPEARFEAMGKRVNALDVRVNHLEKEFMRMHETMMKIDHTMVSARSIGVGLIITTLIGPLIAHWLAAL